MAEARTNSKPLFNVGLPFEKRILELEEQLAGASTESEREELAAELARERDSVFSNLSPWQRVLLARHPLRPRMLEYTQRVLDDFIEVHGDRLAGDDPAMVTGIGRFQDQTVVVVGQQKGVTTDEKVQRNFGMATPQGYRKAMRMFKMAERLRIPVVSFVDTPAAHPGPESEAGGQGSAIAVNILEMLRLNTPVYVVVLGEGGSGGALAIAVGDWISMFENAIYVVCPPERCAEILWRDVEKKEMAATALRVTAAELLELGVIDRVLDEPDGGAHRSPGLAADELIKDLEGFMVACGEGKWTLERRQERFRNMGVWEQVS